MLTERHRGDDRFVYGYFYQLYIAHANTWVGERDDWIVSDYHLPPGYEWKTEVDAKCAYAEVISYEYRERHDCPVDRRHVSCQVCLPIVVNLFGGPMAPFIPNLSDALVSERFAAQLRDSGLKDVEIRPVDSSDGSGAHKPTVFALVYNGPEIRRSGWRGPVSENRCSFCGHTPLCCLVCRDRKYSCPQCGKDCRAKLNKAEAECAVGTSTTLRAVVDPSFWDGSDFLGGASGVITRRALDWLLSVHAAPFCAEPLAADVSGLTRDQREFLETAKESAANGI